LERSAQAQEQGAQGHPVVKSHILPIKKKKEKRRAFIYNSSIKIIPVCQILYSWANIYLYCRASFTGKNIKKSCIIQERSQSEAGKFPKSTADGTW
jgi:branched-subunit amino acid aminotransferase/4-amino-4-deoxychorismate lyase